MEQVYLHIAPVYTAAPRGLVLMINPVVRQLSQRTGAFRAYTGADWRSDWQVLYTGSCLYQEVRLFLYAAHCLDYHVPPCAS